MRFLSFPAFLVHDKCSKDKSFFSWQHGIYYSYIQLKYVIANIICGTIKNPCPTYSIYPWAGEEAWGGSLWRLGLLQPWNCPSKMT